MEDSTKGENLTFSPKIIVTSNVVLGSRYSSDSSEQLATQLARLSEILARDPNAVHALNNADREGTPLHIAAEYGETAIAKLFLEKGANIEAATLGSCFQTLLHVAARCGQTGIVKLLLKNGAAIDSTDIACGTALTLAIQNGFQELAQLLLDNGANVHIINLQNGDTSSHRGEL
jgi:ankyrin repeat protein